MLEVAGQIWFTPVENFVERVPTNLNRKILPSNSDKLILINMTALVDIYIGFFPATYFTLVTGRTDFLQDASGTTADLCGAKQ